MAPRNIIFEKILSIFNCQFISWGWRHKTLIVWTIELIFHVVSKTIVVFDVAPRESASFPNLFQKVKNKHFEKILFCPVGQGKRMCYDMHHLKSSPTVAQCRSGKSWLLVGTRNNWFCAHIHDPQYWSQNFVNYWCFTNFTLATSETKHAFY